MSCRPAWTTKHLRPIDQTANQQGHLWPSQLTKTLTNSALLILPTTGLSFIKSCLCPFRRLVHLKVSSWMPHIITHGIAKYWQKRLNNQGHSVTNEERLQLFLYVHDSSVHTEASDHKKNLPEIRRHTLCPSVATEAYWINIEIS